VQGAEQQVQRSRYLIIARLPRELPSGRLRGWATPHPSTLLDPARCTSRLIHREDSAVAGARPDLPWIRPHLQPMVEVCQASYRTIYFAASVAMFRSQLAMTTAVRKRACPRPKFHP